MVYKFFDKQFLVMPDDKGIIGKEVFYGDGLCELIASVESGDSGMTSAVDNIYSNSAYPFHINNGSCWRLAYYDPNYECKVAYIQGKTIQFKTFDGKWEDVVGRPLWPEHDTYRVKPDKWFVHDMAGGMFYKDKFSDVYVEFEGTEEECDAWIKEHTNNTRRMTNRELARWLAEGKGQQATINGNIFYSSNIFYSDYSYSGGDTAEVPKDVRIRAWDETEWHEPLVEVTE